MFSMLSSTHPFLIFLFLVILPSIFSEGEVQVSKRIGQTVELSCGIEKMDHLMEVMWNKPTEPFLFKVDHEGTHNGDSKGMDHYELDSLNSALKIINLTEETAYKYQCSKNINDKKTVIKYLVTAYDPVKCSFPARTDLEEGKTYFFNSSLQFSGQTPIYNATIGRKVVMSNDQDDIDFLMKWFPYKAESEDDGKNFTMKYTLEKNVEICTRKLSILHPPKEVKIVAHEAQEKGSLISCSSNGNPKADLELKNGEESLAKGLATVSYTIPLDTEMTNITITCHAKNKFTKDSGIYDKKSVTIITKAPVKGLATWKQGSGWLMMILTFITTLLHQSH